VGYIDPDPVNVANRISPLIRLVQYRTQDLGIIQKDYTYDDHYIRPTSLSQKSQLFTYHHSYKHILPNSTHSRAKELANKKNPIAVRFLSSEKAPLHTMSSQSQNQSHKRPRNLSAPLHPPKAHITSLFYRAQNIAAAGSTRIQFHLTTKLSLPKRLTQSARSRSSQRLFRLVLNNMQAMQLPAAGQPQLHNEPRKTANSGVSYLM
jgi:hypothetical protein